MDDSFHDRVQQEMDRTGLDEITAAKIVSGRLGAQAGPSRATPPITRADYRRALTAPPTANEPIEIPETPEGACSFCGGSGFYKEAVPYWHANFGRLLPCACKIAEQDQRRRAEQQQLLQRLQGELGAGLASCRFENFDLDRRVDTKALGVSEVEQQRYLRHAYLRAIEYAKRPEGWLYLAGPCGGGKSHLAAAAAHVLAEAAGYDAYYRSVPDMLDALKEGFKKEDYDERLEAIKAAPLLVLDDIGTEASTEWSQEKLFQIIGERARFGRATILTSNLAIDDLPPRIASRISGQAGEETWLMVSDYRRLRPTR